MTGQLHVRLDWGHDIVGGPQSYLLADGFCRAHPVLEGYSWIPLVVIRLLVDFLHAQRARGPLLVREVHCGTGPRSVGDLDPDKRKKERSALFKYCSCSKGLKDSRTQVHIIPCLCSCTDKSIIKQCRCLDGDDEDASLESLVMSKLKLGDTQLKFSAQRLWRGSGVMWPSRRGVKVRWYVPSSCQPQGCLTGMLVHGPFLLFAWNSL